MRSACKSLETTLDNGRHKKHKYSITIDAKKHYTSKQQSVFFLTEWDR